MNSHRIVDGRRGDIELHAKARGRQISSRNTVLNAVEGILQPIARLLIEHGVSSPVAESLLRAVCVHQAAKIRPAGRERANVSRVALITGIARGEVARILRTQPAEDPTLEAHLHRADRVLAGWHSDPRFSTGDGAPLILPIKGIGRKPSFWSLASRYAPGVYPGLVLSELCRVGAAERYSGGRVRVRAREYRGRASSDESLDEIGSRTRELLQRMVRADADEHRGIDHSPRTRPPKRRRPSREGRRR
jgi:hypothetical protein